MIRTMLTRHEENNPPMDTFPAFDLAAIAERLFSLMALFFGEASRSFRWCDMWPESFTESTFEVEEECHVAQHPRL